MLTTFLTRNEFTTLYGARVNAIANNLEKLYRKQIKIEEHIHFLQECKRNDVIPKGLQLKDTTAVFKNSQLLNQTEKQLRNNLLEAKYKQQRLTTIEVKTQQSILKRYLQNIQPDRIHENDLKWINRHEERPRVKLKGKHERKLSDLLTQPPQIKTSRRKEQNDTSNVINISSASLSDDQLRVLSKGLKFAPTPSSVNIVEVIANTEKSLSAMPHLYKQVAISEISTFVTKWRKPQRPNMTKEERSMLKELKMKDNIIVVQADKGGKVVVMDRKEYIAKVEEKLNDKNLYEVVKDPTNALKKKINTLATKLFQKHKLTEFQKYDFSSNDNLPYVRGQPKIHKSGNPMRIVTCTRSTIMSSVSQFTFGLIRQLRETVENCVTNTSQLISELAKVTLEDNDRLVSLDVQDLFTNIPVEKVVDLVLERIGQSEKFCNSLLTKNDMKDLLLLCLQNSYFTFNGKTYRQKNGLPMGSILSPLLSDIYMHYYIKEQVDFEENEKHWRYVDDILMITQMNETELKIFVNNLNDLEGTIKFTHEYEDNGQLNYLDTILSRNTTDKKIKVRWFRKETASDRLLNYQSCHQQSIKKEYRQEYD